MARPADLSACDRCRRPVPPSNSADFAEWEIVKDGGRVTGMRCPSCQAAQDADGSSSAGG